MRSARPFLLLTGAAAVALVALYTLALGTEVGLHFDDAAISGAYGQATIPRIHEVTSSLLWTVDIASLALLGCGIVGVALIRRRADLAIGAVAVIVGANLTTELLKPLLSRVDPFDGEAARQLRATFPSGHATVAMSLGLALVLVVPRRLRAAAALAGGGYAAAIGISLLALGWHYPSDVAGAYVIAAGWAALAAAGLSAFQRERPRRPAADARRRSPALAAAPFVAFAAALAVTLGLALTRHRAELSHGPLPTHFFLAAAAVGTLSLFLFTVAAALLDRPTTGPVIR